MKKGIVWIIAIVIAVGIVVGCVFWYNSSVNNNENGENDQSGDVVSGDVQNSGDEEISAEAIFTTEDYPKIDAALAAHPLADSIAANLLGVQLTDLDYKYTTGRSSEVSRNLIDGNVDIILGVGISDEDMEYAKEKGVELELVPLTNSAFVFLVNKENPVDELTLEEIRKIYSGDITNWSEVGGEDAEIIAYQRPTGSGSQTGMLQLVMGDVPMKEPLTYEIEIEMGGLIDAVAEYDNAKDALGYSYYYYVTTMYKNDSIKLLAVDGVTPTDESIKAGEYPIYTNVYIITRANEENTNVSKWIDAVQSKRGSKIITDAGYIPVN